MSSPIIEVKNLSKVYQLGNIGATSLKDELGRLWNKARGRQEIQKKGEFWALRDVSFSVQPGEVLGIIGRNGAGKSTLLKILSRITQQTAGEITLRGRVASLLEVGTGFHPDLTGRENVFLNGAILGMTKVEIKRKLDEIVAFAEVEQFLDTPVKRYSSGMYVRLAFAVAAHLEPEILVVDEVLAVGDSQFQKKCLGKMHDVAANEGRTVLFVSHNMDAVNELCSRALLLESGKDKMDGPARDVVAAYLAKGGTEADVDLSKLQHHGPQRFARLTRLRLFDQHGGPATAFKMNEPFVAHIELLCKARMTNVEIGLKISSRYGASIHHLASPWEGLSVDLEPGVHTYEVKIPRLLLFPGTYLIGLWVLKEPEWSDDKVMEITFFSVLKGDVSGHRTRVERYVESGCEVYVPSEWKALDPAREDYKKVSP